MKLYETKIYKDQNVFAISEKDQKWLINNGANTVLVNPFHRNESMHILKKQVIMYCIMETLILKTMKMRQCIL